MPYVSIGDITLEVYEYYEHSEEHSFIYARQNTIYAPSTTQFMGQELRKISLKARLHAMLTKDIDEMYKKLIELAQKGEAQKLIVAEQVKGEFVIDKVKASYLQVGAGGKAVALELELELTEYVQKELRKAKASAKGTEKKTQKRKAKTTQTQKNAQQKQQPKAIIRKEGVSKK